MGILMTMVHRSIKQSEAARAGYDCVRVLIASSRRCSHPLRRCSPVGGRTTHACGLGCFRRWSTDFARQRRDRICEGQETTSLTSGPAVPQRLIHHNYGHDAAGFAPATGALCPSQGCRRWASTRPVSAPGTARSASPDHSTPVTAATPVSSSGPPNAPPCPAPCARRSHGRDRLGPPSAPAAPTSRDCAPPWPNCWAPSLRPTS